MKKQILILFIVLGGCCLTVYGVNNAQADYGIVLVWDVPPSDYAGKIFDIIFTAFSSSNNSITISITFDDLLEVYTQTADYFVNQEVSISTTGLLTGTHTLKITAEDGISETKTITKEMTIDRLEPQVITAQIWVTGSTPYQPGEKIWLEYQQELQFDWLIHDDYFEQVIILVDNVPKATWLPNTGVYNLSFLTTHETTDYVISLKANDLAGNFIYKHWDVNYNVPEDQYVPKEEIDALKEQQKEDNKNIVLGVLVGIAGLLALFAGIQYGGKKERGGLKY